MGWFDTSIYMSKMFVSCFSDTTINKPTTNVRNNMYKAGAKHMFSQLGQANSEFKVQEWKQQQPNDNLFFHGCRGKLADV